MEAKFIQVCLLSSLVVTCLASGEKTISNNTKVNMSSTWKAIESSKHDKAQSASEETSSYALNSIPALPLVIIGPSNGNRPLGAEPNWYGFNRYITRQQKSMPMQVDSSLQTPQGYGTGDGYGNRPSYHNVQHHHHQGQGHHRYVTVNRGPVDDSYSYVPNNRDAGPPQESHQSYSGRVISQSRQPGGPRKAMPVVIKIIPLELTSQYIQEALKTMSFIPLPLSLLGHGQQKENTQSNNYVMNDGGRYVEYNRQPLPRYAGGYSEYGAGIMQQSSLPRPSSHVATPPRSPLEIVYDDEDDDDSGLNYYSTFPRKR